MISFSNFRKEKTGDRVKIICETKMNGYASLPASELWISTDLEHEDYLNENLIDGYLIAAMAFGMFYGQDVKFCGMVSKKLYRNIMNYIQQIMINHDPGLQKVRIEVDGFTDESAFDADTARNIIGAPCSFGVDALLTLYERWRDETDDENRINRVFSFNSGINGAFEDDNTFRLWKDRTALWKKGFDELGMEIINIDTNIHQYLHNKMYVYATACYLGRYFCILNLQNRVKKYFLPSGFSYKEVLKYGNIPFQLIQRGSQDIGLGYEEPFLSPLLSTENIELILDGAQYERSEKVERITEWSFSHRFLNVCQPNRQSKGDLARNCSRCPKCNFTMAVLDAMGKLNKYKDVFDTRIYYANRLSVLSEIAEKESIHPNCADAVAYVKDKGGVSFLATDGIRKYFMYRWRFGELDLYAATIDGIMKDYPDREARIVIWGCGYIGSTVLAVLDITGRYVDGVVDENENLQGQNMFGYEIRRWNDVIFDNDVILVCGMKIFDEVHDTVGKSCTCVNVYEESKKYRI